jgi:hypothetical protein
MKEYILQLLHRERVIVHIKKLVLEWRMPVVTCTNKQKQQESTRSVNLCNLLEPTLIYILLSILCKDLEQSAGSLRFERLRHSA